MKTERTHDVALVKSVMTLPEIFDTVAEDGQDPAAYAPDVVGEIWLAMRANDGDLIGLYNVHAVNAITVEIHAQVLPEQRKEYSRATGLAALRWIRVNLPDCHKVIATVPALYPNVKKFTMSFGFQPEGVNRASYLKGGKIYDQWLLGITRDEIDGQIS